MPVDLTVDVGIVMSGSGLGDFEHTSSSLELLKAVESRPGFLLALDSGGRIKHQYEAKVKRGFGREWVRRLATKGRITIVDWKRLDKVARTTLQDGGFSREDLKYVKTAAFTSCRLLVSHDKDYSAKVRNLLRRRLGVKVLHAHEVD